ncbi:MAG: WD40 repeat domain-containing protein [Armatimonadetes bacterium]|nr:WD40 repeat domain-containing protein [Armatimonadota bacterium]
MGRLETSAWRYAMLGWFLGGVAAGVCGQGPADVVWSKPQQYGALCVAFSPDGSMLALGSGDGYIALRRTSDGALIRERHGASSHVWSLAFSPDGSQLVSGSTTVQTDLDRVKLWRVADGSLIRNLAGTTGTVHSVAFSPDGAYVAAGGAADSYFDPEQRSVRIWQASTGNLVKALAPTQTIVESIAYAPDGSGLAAGNLGQVRLWQTADFNEIYTLSAHTKWVAGLAFSPDGAILASAPRDVLGADITIKLWRASDGALLRALTGNTSTINRIAFTPDGLFLASAAGLRGAGASLRFWRVSDGELIRTFDEGFDTLVRCLAFSPDGAFMAYGDGANVVVARNTFAPAAAATLAVADASGRIGETVYVSARLSSGGAGVRGKAVTFTIGATTATATTDAGGLATAAYHSPEDGGVGSRLVTADFAGDAGFGAVSASGALAVQQAGTAIYVPARTGQIGADVTLRGYLYRLTDKGWLRGRAVAFAVDGVAVGSVGTDAAGHAGLTYTIPEGAGPGHRFVYASWQGDTLYTSSSGAADLAVSKGKMTIWVMSRAAVTGAPTYLQAYARSLPNYQWLPAKALAFTVDGTAVGAAVTDAGGRASVLFAVPTDMPEGAHALGCTFAGDNAFGDAAGLGTLTVGKPDYGTAVYVPGRSGRVAADVFIKGYLYRNSDKAWLGGRALAFAVDGADIGSAVTDAGGQAGIAYRVPEGGGPGQRTITVRWSGDGAYLGSSGSAVLDVSRGATSIWVLSRPVAAGAATYLRAAARSMPGYTWLVGKSMDFSIDTTVVGSGGTGADGYACVLYSVPADMAQGDHTLQCTFSGDQWYLPASGAGTLTVSR